MFSVVIPLYNKKNHILKAILSVLNQTFVLFELIIIDDGSTDGSLLKISHIKDPRLRIYKQQNKGVSAARNFGASVSQKKYIAFLDADDWWDVHFLEEMNKLISKFPDGGLYSSRFSIAKRGRPFDANIQFDDNFYEGYINYFKIYNRTFCQLINSSTVVVPKNIFTKLGGFNKEITRGEDFHLWVRIALNYKVVYLNKCLSFYNQDVDFSTRATKKIHPPESNYVFYFKEFKSAESEDQHLKILLDHIRLGNYLKYLSAGRYLNEAEALLSFVDIKYQPFKIRIFLSLPESFRRRLMDYQSVKLKTFKYLIYLISYINKIKDRFK